MYQGHTNPDGSVTGVPIGVEARAAFISRTYTHLFAAILAFTAIEIWFFTSGLAETMASAMLGTSWLLVLGAFMLVSWLASRAAFTAESMAAQYAALGGFVLAEAILFVPMLFIANSYAPGTIQSAAWATMLGFSALTAVVFVTRRDFSFLRSFLMFGGIAALGGIVVSVIFGFQLGTWFSIAMVVFASGAILHDTSAVIRDFPEDRHVAAALQLFASVALLFWYVLRLFMNRD